MSAIKYYAIIVGGGSGSRMRSDIPKQFMELLGRPVLMHSIEAFYSSEFTPEIIVVLNAGFHDYWKDLCSRYQFAVPHKLVSGGEQRFHSVRCGLQYVTDPSIVAVHDAVRPCITQEAINSSFKQAAIAGSAVTAVKSRDSVRQATETGTISLNRESIYLIQTPQVFEFGMLRKAYEQEYRIEFTDDASVVESSGEVIHLIDGDTKNLKITYPEDLVIAEAYLASEK